MTDERWLLCDPTSDARWTEIPVHRSITSNDPMARELVIIINHDREDYRLRLKLILTK